METYYNVFVRTWWRDNPDWPNGLEPCAGQRRYLRKHVTFADARAICQQYNSTHKPGRLSKKAEFEEATKPRRQQPQAGRVGSLADYRFGGDFLRGGRR